MKLILFETNNLGTISSLFIEVEEGESGREGEGDEEGNGEFLEFHLLQFLRYDMYVFHLPQNSVGIYYSNIIIAPNLDLLYLRLNKYIFLKYYSSQ